MSKAKGEKDAKPEPFEKSLEALEELVRELEAGDKGLEESLALFEKGVALSKDLTARLEEAKTKVEALSAEGGKLSKKPFAPRED
jgi:exodeoxyribonuclease VII small subunit